MRERWLRAFVPLLGLLLFGAAVAILHHELRAYHYRDVVGYLSAIPRERILLAVGATVASYVVLTGYDALAVRYVGRALPYRRVALASFVAYAFSNNVGTAFVGGSAVRYRMFSSWDLSPADIARAIGCNVLTFWLGFFALGGFVLLFAPPPLPASLNLPAHTDRVFGALLLLGVATYVFWTARRPSPLRLRGFELRLPGPRFTLAQIALSSLDWGLAAGTLYLLLPAAAGLSFPIFVGAFLVAQILGLVSNIPAGLGVFDTAIVLLLAPYLPGDKVLGSLVAFRLLYYLLPLGLAVVLLGGYEALERRSAFVRAQRAFGRWVPELVPRVFAVTIFVGGAILLASGATPAAPGRMAWMARAIPLPLLEISHFLGSLVGMGLVLLARAVQQRADAAYPLTIALLGTGAVVSLLKGLDYEEAIVLSVMLAAFIPCRPYFYRRTSLLRQPFTVGWLVAIGAVVVGTWWLVFWSYRHVEYSNELWWHFGVARNAPRSLRASVGALALLAGYFAARLMRPAAPRPRGPTPDELERASVVVKNARPASAHLALLGDKSFLFSESGNGFVMYGVEGRSWVSMGDPVGPPAEREELVWQFRELSDRHGGWTVFYEVGSENLPLYLDLGLSLLKLGEAARVPLEDFSLEGSSRKGLRQNQRRMLRDGCEFAIVDVPDVSPLLDELERVSSAWLIEKHTREKRFSLGCFDRAYVTRTPVALVRRAGAVVAFANLWLGAERSEISVDLMRHLPEAPNGVMEYLFTELMLWGRAQGYGSFDLGMAPLSGFERRRLAPLWNRLGAFLFRYGEHFYGFQGLRSFKGKFDPVWEPRYIASPGGLVLPRIFTNVASLISGGVRGVVAR